jgi:hypothetical protein
MPLLDLLRRFILHETSLERDHLFGLLGLAGNDGQDLEFAPDYDEALDAVVQRYARRFIERKEIYILEDAGLSRTKAQDPSWIPPWTTGGKVDDAKTHEQLVKIPDREVDATTGTVKTVYAAATSMPTDARVVKEPLRLRIRGVFIDSFSEIAKPVVVPSHLRRSTSKRWLCKWILESDKLLNSLKSYHTGESLKGVQLRTFLGNRVRGAKNSEPSETGATFRGIKPSQALLDTHMKNFGELYRIEKDDSKPLDWSSALGKELEDSLFAIPCPPFIQTSNRFFVSKRDFVGRVPEMTDLDDLIFLPYGSQMPYVVRPSDERRGTYRLIGGCYVHGIMEEGEMENYNFEEMTIDIH